MEVISCAISSSPSRHDRRTRRSGFREILRDRGLPRDGNALSACEWAKGVWRFDVAQQGASSRAPALTRTALAGARDLSGLLEFRCLDDLLS